MGIARRDKITSLLWNENLRTNFEYMDFALKRTSKMQKTLSGTISDKQPTQRIISTINILVEAKSLLSKMLEEKFIGTPLSIDLHFRFKGLFQNIQLRLSDLMTVYLQEICSHAYHKFSDKAKRDTKKDISELDPAENLKMFENLAEKLKIFNTPRETAEAISIIMEECSYLLYGKPEPEFDFEEPVVINWPYSDYRFLRASTVISMPPHDVTKLCHWSPLMHESFHCKLYKIIELTARRDDAIQSKDYASKSAYEGVLCKILSDSWEETIRKTNKLREKFVKIMLERMGEIYEYAFNEILNENLSISREKLRTQFDEILCDVASVKTAGVSNVLLSGSSEASTCRNPFLGVALHLLELEHPPDAVRVLYQYEILKEPKLGFNKQTILDVLNQIKSLVSIDLVGRKKKRSEKITSKFLNEYLDALLDTNSLRKISDLVDQLLCNTDYYCKERWNILMQYYEKIKNPVKIEDTLRPFDFVNLAWLKLMDISKESLSYEKYIQEYKNNQGFFQKIWQDLISSGRSWKRKL